MFRSFAAVAILTVSILVGASPAAVQAASAKTNGGFKVAISHDQTNAWYQAHHAEVFKSANCRIVQNLGNGQYMVETNTPGGLCRYVLKETRESGKTKAGQPTTIYRVTYVRNVSGRLADFELTISMTGLADGKTEIGMWIMADVAGRFVPMRAVSGVLEGSKSGCTSYILNNAR